MLPPVWANSHQNFVLDKDQISGEGRWSPPPPPPLVFKLCRRHRQDCFFGCMIIRAKLRVPPKLLGVLLLWCFTAFRSVLNLDANDSERRYTPINLSEIVLNQTEIRLYLPFSDWFGTQTYVRTFVFQINGEMVNTIWFRFDLIRFQKDFCVVLRMIVLVIKCCRI